MRKLTVVLMVACVVAVTLACAPAPDGQWIPIQADPSIDPLFGNLALVVLPGLLISALLGVLQIAIFGSLGL